jgi:hypothetical protein
MWKKSPKRWMIATLKDKERPTYFANGPDKAKFTFNLF